MRRLSVWLIGPLLLATTVLSAVTAGPAAAVGVRRVAGDYTVYGKFDKDKPYTSFPMTLNRDGTGTDHFGDTIVWTITDRDLEMTFDDGLWHYSGTKTRAGFNNIKHPGTATNINGGTFPWYAVKITS
jgi:hypothetical protein